MNLPSIEVENRFKTKTKAARTFNNLNEIKNKNDNRNIVSRISENLMINFDIFK
jgi:hypothetical protein